MPASDALLSCAIASTGEVDEILSVAKAAGGRTFEAHEIPHVSGRRQYVGTFTDPDGHLWQLVCNLTDAHGAAELEHLFYSKREGSPSPTRAMTASPLE